jgi:hypothetical protein
MSKYILPCTDRSSHPYTFQSFFYIPCTFYYIIVLYQRCIQYPYVFGHVLQTILYEKDRNDGEEEKKIIHLYVKEV